MFFNLILQLNIHENTKLLTNILILPSCANVKATFWGLTTSLCKQLTISSSIYFDIMKIQFKRTFFSIMIMNGEGSRKKKSYVRECMRAFLTKMSLTVKQII